MNVMNAEFDSNGILTQPSFHDGYLKGIMLEANNHLSLHCESIDGMSARILIPSTISLRADNFRQGNIIFEFRIYTGDQCPKKLIGRVEDFVQPVDDNVDKRISEITELGWSLLELGSSYGCELLALFDGKREDVKIIAA